MRGFDRRLLRYARSTRTFLIASVVMQTKRPRVQEELSAADAYLAFVSADDDDA